METPQEKTGITESGGIVLGRLVVVFFISACMFVLGVMVGRNTAPVNFDMKNLDSKLSDLEASVLAGNENGLKEEEKIPDDISFEFYDKLKEETVIDEHAAGRPRVLAPKHEKPDSSEIQLERAMAEKQTRPSPQPGRHDRSSADSGKKYAIQVASMRNPESAEKIRDKFSDKGYPAFTKMAYVEGKGKWCRVRLGPYSGRQQAEDDLSRLQKAGVDAMIILND
ncbi:MAG: SPOR domain-containing protein [Desulfosalsimonas sp.]